MKLRHHAGLAAATTAFILLQALTAGCGPSSSQVQQVSINVETEDQRAVYVDNFINLSGNEDFSIFEESVPEMLAETLGSLRTIRIIPREQLRKQLAMSDDDERATSVTEAARSLGADYLIDGWIDKTDKGTYRVYANLLNLKTSKVRTKMAAVEFKGKNESLEQITKLVEQVGETVSLPQDKLDNFEYQLVTDYDLHRQYMRAWQSYKRGQPKIALRLLEQVIEQADTLIKRDVEAFESGQRNDVPAVYFRYIAGQIYNEEGNVKRARELMEPVYEARDKFGKKEVTRFIEGIWKELNGEYDAAVEIFTELKDVPIFNKEYYIRTAQITERYGDGPVRALAIMKEGTERFAGDVQLQKMKAEYEMQVEGEKAFERYAEAAVSRHSDPVTTEVASAVITEKIKRDKLKLLSTVMPDVAIYCDDTNVVHVDGTIKIGPLAVKLNQFESEMDTSCEITLEGAESLGYAMVDEGQFDLALQLAGVISDKSSAKRSKAVSILIKSAVSIAEGHYNEAIRLVDGMPKDCPSRYLTLGQIYLNLGKTSEAVAVMEKALKFKENLHPIAYYQIANAHLLAGHYKKWQKYNKIYLTESLKELEKKEVADSGKIEQ